MLVSIAGSQGVGKSVIVDDLKNYNFDIIERKTSRSILNDWNVSLDEVNTNPELTVKFQNEILKRKYDDDIMGTDEKNVFITERTFIDLLTYATISLGKENGYSEWLTRYGEKCIENQSIYDLVFYIRGGHFKVSEDSIRGHNKFYSHLVDSAMLSFYEKYHTNKESLIIIDSPSHEYRIDTITKDIFHKYRQKKHEQLV